MTNTRYCMGQIQNTGYDKYKILDHTNKVYLAEGILERGDILEAVAGHHAVVVVPGEDEGRGVLRVGVLLDVVEGGDTHQVGELLLHVAAAVVAHPGVAHRELVEPGGKLEKSEWHW